MKEKNNKFLQLAYKINNKVAPIIGRVGKIIAEETARMTPEDALAISLMVRELAKSSLDFAAIAESQINRLKKE